MLPSASLLFLFLSLIAMCENSQADNSQAFLICENVGASISPFFFPGYRPQYPTTDPLDLMGPEDSSQNTIRSTVQMIDTLILHSIPIRLGAERPGWATELSVEHRVLRI